MTQQPLADQSLFIIEASRSYSIGLLWMSDQSVKRPLPANTQHSQQTNIHALGGIRTHNPSKREATDLRVRPRGLWDSLLNSSSIHSAVRLTTGPKPLPKPALHIVRYRASSFKWEYPLLSLRSYSSFLCLLPRLLATSISPFIFPSITRCRRQFPRKMWPIQLET